MISRICICCGEPFSCKVNEGVDNPNICAACSRMADGSDTELEVDRLQPVMEPSALVHRSTEVQNTS